MPTKPPQVRLPTSGPSFVSWNMNGSASPPEPAYSFVIMTFGPKIAPTGDVKSVRVARSCRGRAAGGA